MVHVRELVVHVWELEGLWVHMRELERLLRTQMRQVHIMWELERLLRTRTRQVHTMRELEVLAQMLEHLLRTSTRQELGHLLITSTQQELGHLLRTSTQQELGHFFRTSTRQVHTEREQEVLVQMLELLLETGTQQVHIVLLQ